MAKKTFFKAADLQERSLRGISWAFTLYFATSAYTKKPLPLLLTFKATPGQYGSKNTAFAD